MMAGGLPPFPGDDLPWPSIFAPQQVPEEVGSSGYRGPKLINGPLGMKASGKGNGFSPFASKSQWFYDNGASHSMTASRGYLHDYVRDTGNPVTVSGIGPVPIPRAGTGTLKFHTEVNGVINHVELKGVWQVPNLSSSLLSGQHLSREGYWATQGGPQDPTY